MTNPDPPNDDIPMPSVSADEKPQLDDDGKATLTGRGEDERDHHHTTVLPSLEDIHAPHADRFEPKEETWLYGEGAKVALPTSVVGYSGAGIEVREGESPCFQGPTLAPFQPACESPYAASGTLVKTQTKCAYCVGIEYHAPHLYDQSKCTCPTRAFTDLNVPKAQYASTVASISGPRYEPSQVLRRAGLMSGPPPMPANFPFSVAASKFSTAGAPTGFVSPSHSSKVGGDRSTYRFNSQPSRGGLPQDPPWRYGIVEGKLPAELMPRSNTHRQPVTSRPVVFSPGPSLAETEEVGQITLDYPSQPLSSAWDSDSDLDTIVDNENDDRPTEAAVPSPGLNTNESRSRKRKRRQSELSHLRRDLQQFRQPRTRQARSPPPSPPGRQRRRAGSDGDLPGSRTEDFRTERQVTEIQIDAMDLLERSHASLRAHLASYFDSNWTLRAELEKARWGERRAEARLAEAEELCLHHHVIPAPRA